MLTSLITFLGYYFPMLWMMVIYVTSKREFRTFGHFVPMLLIPLLMFIYSISEQFDFTERLLNSIFMVYVLSNCKPTNEQADRTIKLVCGFITFQLVYFYFLTK